jgi:DivIVA domain-containing protein
MRHVELFLLAVVAVAVLAGVAVAASGRGAMTEPVPDSPSRGLPDGPLGPEDLDAVRFPMALRGYRMAEVDAVLDRLRDELARMRTDSRPGSEDPAGRTGDHPE